MWIAAQSNIRLLRGVPLDPTYDHTWYFDSANQQANFFINYTKYNLTTYVYQRVNKGSIRVAILADYLYDCNYMMFKNDAYGNKWFYAFITSVEYINDNVTEIRYEMDDLQTWHFDYNLEDCFVEREHSVSDEIGDNILAENLETGDFIRENPIPLWSDLGDRIVIFSGSEIDGSPMSGRMLNGIYTGVFIKICADAAEANNFIAGYTRNNRADSILGIYIVPVWMLSEANFQEGYSANFGAYPDKKYDNIDGYVPKNKKLFTSQFNNIILTNNQGSSIIYAYEKFTSQSCAFRYCGTVANGIPTVIAYAPNEYYKGGSINDRVVLDCFAVCPYNIDGFRAWWAENQGTFIAGLATDIIMPFIEADNQTSAMPDRLDKIDDKLQIQGNAFLHAAANAINYAGQYIDKRRLPPDSRQVGVATSLKPYGAMNIAYQRQYIRAEYARIIDDYFTRFGYKTCRVKPPNRNARPYFTYCKTIGCTINGSIPGDSARKICSIYDTGITWWKPNAVIGDYSVNNSPV